MQPILPTSVDRVSAQVLGFDANAYLNGTASTLAQKFNLSGNYNAPDRFEASYKAKAKKSIKDFFSGLGALAATGLGIFCLSKGLKGKNVSPKTLRSSINTKISTWKFPQKIADGLVGAKDFCVKKFKDFAAFLKS